MSCCCNSVLYIGCFCKNNGLTLDFAAPADGETYRLSLQYHQSFVAVLSDETVAGEPVFFNLSTLNPFYEYRGQLLDANGDAVILYDADSVAYDCLQFKPQTGGKNGKSIPLTLTI